jgi:hypothetical protein
LQAFGLGLSTHGVLRKLTSLNKYLSTDPPDVAVVFGTFKKAIPASFRRGAIIESQKLLGKQSLILEKGYVKRDEYYASGWNALNGHANFCNCGMDDRRWQSLNIELERQRPRGEHILLCGQVPHDASCQHVPFIEWLHQRVVEIQEKTDRPIIFRPHPLAADMPLILGTELSEATLEEDFNRAAAVVTLNSNMGVLSMIAGLPTYALDPGSMVWGLAWSTLRSINDPQGHDDDRRTQWAHDIAYAQWTLDEMRSGAAWTHLSRGLLRRGEAA